MEPKETPSCLIPRPLFLFTQQLDILVTTLPIRFPLLWGIAVNDNEFKANKMQVYQE